METIKIKPSHESQGEFILINKDDFDPKKHELFDENKPKQVKSTRKTTKEK